MFNIMYPRYILTIAALIVIAMMDVLYYSKPRSNNKLKHKLFAFFIFLNTLVLLVEVAIMFVFAYNLPFKTCEILLRLRDLVLIVYFSILMHYYYSAINRVQYNTFYSLIKNEKILIPHLIFTVIVVVAHFFLPYYVVDKNSFNTAFGGPAFYLAIGYCVITTLETIFFVVLRNRHNINSAERFSLVWLFVLMLVILFGQTLLHDISIMGLVSSVYVLGVYFVLENPDLELVEEIDSLTDEIERANHTKLDFLSNVSKEMITPMNSIVLLSDSILKNPSMDETKILEDIKQIELSSKNFLEIINNSLDISNVESDQDKLIEKNYSLITVLNSLVNFAQERLSGKKVKLILNIDNSTPNSLYGDSTKIYQVLLNVVSNAIKYTEVGKISFSLKSEIKGSKAVLKFKVNDTGFGIKKEDYDKIFIKYSRLDDAVSKGIDGVGLGLAIVKKYVDLLGGTVSVDSVYGAGTTFYVEIPQQIVNMNSLVGDYNILDSGNKEDNELLDCSKFRILIVEDDHLNLEVTKRLLKRYGFEIDTCTNGNDCIFKYKKGEHYDMILIDHIMPVMSGIEVMQVIRKLDDYKTPTLVALTANTYTGSKDVYLNEGFDDYLAKPIDIIELDSLVNKYFR